MPIDPDKCKTGYFRDDDSAPSIHVREADARLIAAAPDLLAACEAFIRWDVDMHNVPAELTRIAAMIRKAADNANGIRHHEGEEIDE
jgi:hypothetical protein